MLVGSIEVGYEFANRMKWIPAELVGVALLGFWGFKLYTAIKEPSDTWDETLKWGGIVMMAAAGAGFLAAISQLIR